MTWELPDDERLWMVKILVALGTMWCLWIARRVWTAPRVCPRAPIAGCFSAKLPENALFQLLLIFLTAILVCSKLALPTAGLVCLALTLSCFDWTRYRPWLHQNLTILTVIAAFQDSQASEGLNICRLTSVSIYFWAGVLKMNASFFHRVLPFFLAPMLLKIPLVAYQRWFRFWGQQLAEDPESQSRQVTEKIRKYAFIVPLVEASIGVGLLFPLTCSIAMVLAIAMHCFILLWVAAVGPKKCPTIGPWNIGMLLTTATLFWGADSHGCWDILLGSHCGTHLMVLFVFMLLPALGLFNLLDPVLSHGHWSGRHVYGFLGLSQRTYRILPKTIQEHCKPTGPSSYYLDLGEWFVFEGGVPPVQQERLLVTVAQDFQRYATRPDDVSLTVLRMPSTCSTQQETKLYTGQVLFDLSAQTAGKTVRAQS